MKNKRKKISDTGIVHHVFMQLASIGHCSASTLYIIDSRMGISMGTLLEVKV